MAAGSTLVRYEDPLDVRCRAPARWDHLSASDMGPVRGVVNVGDVMIVGVRTRGQGVRGSC
jgi:hypothetical protein